MDPLLPLFIMLGAFGLYVLVALFGSIRIVPARTAQVVERLGKYSRILDAGFHVLVPFFDKVAYIHTLKEVAIDVAEQPCFTEDNVRVKVGGVLYLTVTDPKKASYGISDYRYATIQLAQTTMRSLIGRLELDRTFEGRESINAAIVQSLDEATGTWGVHVTRYEIQNITMPGPIVKTMELQVKADRDKRAAIAKSLGEMESKINRSVGIMEESINKSEGEKQKLINEAEGKAQEILSLSKATATGIAKIAESITQSGGEEAVTMQLMEKYIGELKKLGSSRTKVILPLDMTDMESITKLTKKIVQR